MSGELALCGLPMRLYSSALMNDAPPPPQCSAIIVAAGSSRRMGFDKLTATLAGITVLQRAIETFLAANSVGEVILVCSEKRSHCIDLQGILKRIIRVDGGAERQDSVAAGLAAASCEWIAVHDAARPLISPLDIDRCLAEAVAHGAAALARRVTETLKRTDNAGFSAGPVSRENLWLTETPQIFHAPLLRVAYAAVTEQKLTVTDEVSALEAIHARVKLVESTKPNPKITTPADLALAEALLIS